MNFSERLLDLMKEKGVKWKICKLESTKNDTGRRTTIFRMVKR